ncbi:MAG: beta-mannosidase, partial [Paramuribaculum sp.]|nr:beta-mannosidase [Paramuribaculum sp.]
MRRLLDILIVVVACLAAVNCTIGSAPAADRYVSVGPDGQFRIGGHTYNYIGTNFWYGALLASEGRGGDRVRLARELDTLQALGLTNLRIMVGGDGRENLPHHIMPVLQTAPGVYNDTLLAGLDYLLAELERRDMKAVLYLNNSWEWSGGYGAYLEWAGMGDCPDPADGYREYCDYVAQFVLSDSAKAMAANHVRNIVSRTNSVTGRPYSESPAIMAWQIANEPRAFCSDSLHKEAFARWIASTAELIKSLDANHLVSTGSEGLYGCEVDLDLWERIHRDPNIDYGIIHVWPYNWRWVDSATVVTGVDSACTYALEYITPHVEIMRSASKPLVIEEFGYPRDGMAIAPGTPTTGRDIFYD